MLLESKIIAVADIVEAMSSDRPYRPTLGLQAALEEVQSMAGTKLDPDVVRTCCALFGDKRLGVHGLDWAGHPVALGATRSLANT